MSKEIPLELIHQLAASNADNAAESITLEIRLLAEKHGWTIAEVMDVGALVCAHRQLAVETAMDAARLAIAEILGVKA